METKNKKNTIKPKNQNEITEKKPKSAIRLFREKYPFGLGYEITDMRAVLR